MKNHFFTRRKFISLPVNPPAGKVSAQPMKATCPKCQHDFKSDSLGELQVCTVCGFHKRLDARQRLDLLVDPHSWEEFGADLSSLNFLGFPGYSEKLEEARNTTGSNEAAITGIARILSIPVVLVIMDHGFMGGSMGVVVGEKIILAVEKSLEQDLPLIIFSASGGARMQEGMAALMQMARTAAAVQKLHEAGLLYVCVMTDPTTGGVSASFAALADIIIAEPGALIGFTGPRVIQQTIKQPLPDGFQRAEYLLEHGMIDAVVPRGELRPYLAAVVKLHLSEQALQEEE